jgi:hypothetical protein
MNENYGAGGGLNGRTIALCVALVAIIIVILGNAGPGHRPKPQPVHYGYHGLPDPGVDPDAAEPALRAMVKKSGGDYSKLSHDEQVWIEGMTAHHGAETLKILTKQYAAEAKAQAHKTHPGAMPPKSGSPSDASAAK